ncbi:MAG TPA: dephospho-CoA kinase [Chitinophagaceae bacterium]|nr:dephospho-CoA kinase [Chitinophagaceae bacterium]
MLKIGLTGGIGSGKSTVAKIFETLGIPVYYADDAAKELMNTDPDLKELIIKNFGSNVYTDNKLNRSYLASIVFADKLKLEILNSLTHPATINAANEWIALQKGPYIIKEAALLFESDAHKHLDAIIGVSSPIALRMKRVMQRDNLTEEDVQKRINRQMDEAEKMRRCDYIIHNDESTLLIPQVLALDKKFRAMATAAI